MKLGLISLKIRQAETRFKDHVSGVAELQRIIDQEDGHTINKDTLFVVTLGDNASQNTLDQGINQKVSESFAVIAAVANDGRYSDRSGIDAIDLMHDVRDELWGALLGWEWPDASGKGRETSQVSYTGAAVISVDHAWVWMEFDFAADLRISNDDGVQEPAAEQFLRAYAQLKDDDLPLKAGTALPLDDDDVMGEARAELDAVFSFSTLPMHVSSIRNISYGDGEIYGDIGADTGYAWFDDEVTANQFARFAALTPTAKYALVVTDSAGLTARGYIGRNLGEAVLSGTELLTDDAGFETWTADGPAPAGNLTYWSEDNINATTRLLSKETTIIEPNSGAASAKLQAVGNDGTLLGVNKGATGLLNGRYRIVVWKYITVIAGGAEDVRIQYNGAWSSLSNITYLTTDSDWVEVVGEINATSSASSSIGLLGTGTTAAATFYFDSASIKRVTSQGLAIKAVPEGDDSRGWENIETGFDATDITTYAVYPV